MRDAQRRPQLREPEHGFLPWWFHFLNGAGKGSSFDDVRLARNSPRLLDEGGARRAQLRGLLWMPTWLLFPMACKYFRSWPPSDIGDPARLLYIEPSLAEGASGIDNGRGEVAHFSAGGYDPLLALPLGHGERIEPLQASFAPSEPGRTRPRRSPSVPLPRWLPASYRTSTPISLG
jgi:hypothetical protein